MHTHYSYNRQSAIDPAKIVGEYIGRKPSADKLRVLSEEQWAIEVPETSQDRLMGGVAAITTPDGQILIRHGYEDSAIHELLHTVGFMPKGTNDFLNEGVTQVVAEEICEKSGIRVRKTYDMETKFVRRYILPLMDMSLRTFARAYATSSDKAKVITDRIWQLHSKHFSNAEDWGSTSQEGMRKDLHQCMGYSVYLEYLVDELGLGKPM